MIGNNTWEIQQWRRPKTQDCFHNRRGLEVRMTSTPGDSLPPRPRSLAAHHGGCLRGISGSPPRWPLRLTARIRHDLNGEDFFQVSVGYELGRPPRDDAEGWQKSPIRASRTTNNLGARRRGRVFFTRHPGVTKISVQLVSEMCGMATG